MTLWRTDQLATALYSSVNLTVFPYFPFSNENILKIQIRQFLRTSLWTILDFAILYHAVLARPGGPSFNALTNLSLGMVHWLFVVAGAFALLAFAPLTIVRWSMWACGGGTMALFFFHRTQPQIVEWVAAAGDWIPPVGWILHGMGISPEANFGKGFGMAVLSAFVLSLGPVAYRRLRDSYPFDQMIDSNVITSENIERELKSVSDQNPERIEFPTKFAWATQGFVEKTVARCLKSKEKSFVEFLSGADPEWTKSLRNLAFLWISLLLGVEVLMRWFRSSADVATMPAFIAICFLLRNLAGSWPGLACSKGHGLQSPQFALYPIEFWEMSRTILKVNFVRIGFSAVIMLAVVYGALSFGARASLNLPIGTLALKFVFLLVCIQPMVIPALISPSTNDTKKFSFLAIATCGAVTLVVAGAIFLFAKTSEYVLPSGASFAVLSLIAFAWYGKKINSGEFDLVPLAKNEITVS